MSNFIKVTHATWDQEIYINIDEIIAFYKEPDGNGAVLIINNESLKMVYTKEDFKEIKFRLAVT